MSTKPNSRFNLKTALIGLLVAALAGLAVWALFGREPSKKAPTVQQEPANKDAAKRKMTKAKARGMRRNPAKRERRERPPVPQGRFEGEVVAVMDGDTIDVMHDGAPVRVRLDGIDCPEKRQPFGSNAKQRTSELAFGKTVAVDVAKEDRFGRAVGRVTLPDGEALNEILLRDGLAWWYKLYSDDRRLESLETDARNAKIGLWADPTQTPPWDFRKNKAKRKGGQRRQRPNQGAAGAAGAAADFQ